MEGQGHSVVFTPSGLSGEVPDGTTVLEAARVLGVDLDSVCGGRGICGRCQIDLSVGEFAKWSLAVQPDHLSPRGPTEQDYRGKRALANERRLGCAARVVGDVVIDVPAQSQIHRQVIAKSVSLRDLVVDPIYTLHYVPNGDVTQTLKELWGLNVSLDETTLPDEELTVAVRSREVVACVWPGYVDRAVGIAFDVGSTTIAGHLVDLATGDLLASAGAMNPQIRFGEDLMSRVSYVMMNPGGDAKLTNAVRGALDELATELLTSADEKPERVLDVTLVGNPIMHHLVLGLDPTPLGQAPFPLAVEGKVETTAVELGLGLPNATGYVPPCIAGHVGADAAAAILNEGPHRGKAVQLLVDVGTNAEIVLGNDERLFAASSPTGPAFEGAQISSGQRATVGAIERVRIDRDTLEPTFKVIGSDLWSGDPGFEQAVGERGVSGICGSGIIEVISELVTSGAIDSGGLIVGTASKRSDRIVADGRTFSYVLHGDIRVTQADVRAVQLAKAALRAGIELLLEHAELSAVDEVRLAGAFGANIDPAHAMVVGLIPEAPLESVMAVGNSAGSGAIRVLVSAQQRAEIESLVATVTKIETATEPRFQDLFVEALGFPLSTAPTAQGSNRGARSRRRR